MKKVISILLVVALMLTCLFVLTGCDKGGAEGGKEADKPKTATISEELGKGIISVEVPQNEDGTAKYEFTKEKPEGFKRSGTFYLVTDKAIFAFATSGLVYNTNTQYKEKYGETKATFDGYLAYMDDTSLSSRPQLAGCERFDDLNGRKAIRYYARSGGSGEYTYYGYNYRVGVDDIYPGSGLDLIVYYKLDEFPSEVQEFDEETLAIIDSLKITAKE